MSQWFEPCHNPLCFEGTEMRDSYMDANGIYQSGYAHRCTWCDGKGGFWHDEGDDYDESRGY